VDLPAVQLAGISVLLSTGGVLATHGFEGGKVAATSLVALHDSDGEGHEGFGGGSGARDAGELNVPVVRRRGGRDEVSRSLEGRLVGRGTTTSSGGSPSSSTDGSGVAARAVVIAPALDVLVQVGAQLGRAGDSVVALERALPGAEVHGVFVLLLARGVVEANERDEAESG
jgi:hypothetical protein